MEFWPFLFDIVGLLTGAMLLGGLFTRLGQSPITGYLLAGMLLGGPGSIKLVGSEKEIEAIAELGVSLLLFSLGLEFSWNRLKAFGMRTLFVGVFQVLLTLFGTAGISRFLGLPFTEALVVGAMIAVSSTACVLRVLIDRGETDTVHGRYSIAVLLTQDIMVVPLALLVGLLGQEGSATEGLTQAGEVLLLFGGLVLGLCFIVYGIGLRLLGTFTLEHNRELGVLLAVILGLGSAGAAHEIGVSPALGAFIAGMLLGSSPFATQVRADISSLRVVLLTLFFGAAGMIADPLWIARHWSLVLSLVFLLIAGKTGITWLVFRVFGHSSSIGAATGLCLSQIGEFAFVLATIGRDSGTLTENTHLTLVSCAVVTLFLTPYLVRLAPGFGAFSGKLARSTKINKKTRFSAERKPAPEVVVIGFGPAGEIAASELVNLGEKLLVIDLNRTTRKKAREIGFQVHIGDASEIEVLTHARISSSKIVIVAIPNPIATRNIIRHVRKLAPQSKILARSRHERDIRAFEKAGAHLVVGDEGQVGIALAKQVKELGTQ